MRDILWPTIIVSLIVVAFAGCVQREHGDGKGSVDDDNNTGDDDSTLESPLIGGAEKKPDFQVYTCEPSQYSRDWNELLCGDCEENLYDYGDYEEEMPEAPGCFEVVELGGLLWTVCSPESTARCCAVCYATGLTFCGLEGWRLPTVVELNSIVDPYRPTNPYIRRPFQIQTSILRLVWSVDTHVNPFGYEFSIAFDFSEIEEEWLGMCASGSATLLVHDLDGIDWPPDDGSVVPATPER